MTDVMNLKLGPSLKLAHTVEKLKQVYFEKYTKQTILNNNQIDQMDCEDSNDANGFIQNGFS